MARSATKPPARAAKPEPMATPGEVAEVLRVPEHTLACWRSQGKGPAWSKIGRHVRYDWADVDAYRVAQRKTGTAA
jgi:excisionase family DNA binding protein